MSLCSLTRGGSPLRAFAPQGYPPRTFIPRGDPFTQAVSPRAQKREGETSNTTNESVYTNRGGRAHLLTPQAFVPRAEPSTHLLWPPRANWL